MKKNIYRITLKRWNLFKKTISNYLLTFFAVTGSEDNHSMLEGILRGKKGLFPSHCVQEVRLRNPHSVRQAITTAPRAALGPAHGPNVVSAAAAAGNSGSNIAQHDNSNVSANNLQRHFATAQRAKDSM